ncbi:MAG: adenylyltransferase/cytidyltransferase family protein [Candidatus Diapherotrites archaeon]|nr:adenylyltransferase/cytidyltransferase family protein [Candidatus Diapherotrites archaeon]
MKALFVGRFQPFHDGHAHAIKAAQEKYGEVVVLIGSAQKHGTKTNPLTADERAALIRKEFPDIKIVTQDDVFNDERWVREIKEKTDFDVVVSSNDWVKRCFEKAGYEVVEPELHEPERYSGTKMREGMQ